MAQYCVEEAVRERLAFVEQVAKQHAPPEQVTGAAAALSPHDEAGARHRETLRRAGVTG